MVESDHAMTSHEAELTFTLENLLEARLEAGPLEVRDLKQLSGGASRETWSFDAVAGDGTLNGFILRLDPPSARPGLMALEARVMRAAYDAGVPTPRIVVASVDPPMLGAPAIIMERVEGETLPRRIFESEVLASAREVLVRQCAQSLARIHAIPLGRVPKLENIDALERCRTLVARLGEARPVFELALRWLEENRPPDTRNAPAVLHGDFRLGNLIVGPEGLRCVLDWEMVHAGDPLEDLGWLCTKAWRFGHRLPVGGFADYEELCEAYAAAGGTPVDRGALQWWETLNALKWGGICGQQGRLHLDGKERSVELAAIGRRISEAEWDLLYLLLGTPPGIAPALPEQAAPTSSQFSPASLVEAVREMLSEVIVPVVDGRPRLLSRVAVRVLEGVERELILGHALSADVARSLERLGYESEEAVAAGVRDGSISAADTRLHDFLWESVRARLTVANPGYQTQPFPRP